MKLVILCGSLEPGKDGVGDYSRRLARHCRENGHSVIVVSLNDQWISANDVDVNEIRLTRNNSWPSRMNVLQCRLETFRPDWISVQFVPYAYHHRGFCSELVFHLSSIHIQVQWELMFHELWLGLNSTDSLKFRLTGWMQRRAALRLHRALRPSVTHTQSTAYVSFLNR